MIEKEQAGKEVKREIQGKPASTQTVSNRETSEDKVSLTHAQNAL